MTSRLYSDLRLLVLRENWLGNTGLSAQDAFMALGALVESVSDADYMPITGRSAVLRMARRLITPALRKEYNRDVIRTARKLRPHLLVVFKGPHLEPATLLELRSLGTRLFCFYPDVSYFEHGSLIPKALPLYDWIFTTKSFGLAELKRHFGIGSASFLPHAFDSRVHRPHLPHGELVKLFGAEASFIGSWSKKKERILEDVRRERPNLRMRIWGNGWGNLSADSLLRPVTAFAALTGLAYSAAISCSRINLAILFEGPAASKQGDLITSRTFHIPASGGLMLHERTEDLLTYFQEDKEVVCFDSTEEMLAKIDWLLRDESARERIAHAGRECVLRSHSWEHRARTILDMYVAMGPATLNS